MTASDILYIVSTVSITQVICDIVSKKFVFSREDYKHRISTLERARIKKEKASALPPPSNNANSSNNYASSTKSTSSSKALDKYNKKIQRAEEEYGMAASNVSQKHIGPNIASSLVFLILYRVLGLEYQGKVVGILPYEPWGLIRRISMRGITLSDTNYIIQSVSTAATHGDRIKSVNQACGFLFIYLLCTMSVKFTIHKLLGQKPPTGADKGFLTMMDDPRSQKVLQSLGVDTDEINEIRKSL